MERSRQVMDVIKRLRYRKYILTTAESCTGGLISSAITDIPGSSEVFDRGFVTYSNESKNEMLGVPLALIEQYGAVSTQVAKAMAKGALEHSSAVVSIAVTGIAGPGGGSVEKPVGTVFIASAVRESNCIAESHMFAGDRVTIREQVVQASLRLLVRQISGE